MKKFVSIWDELTFCPMGEKLFLMKFPTIGQVHFDSIGVEVRKWGTSGVKFQNEKYTLLLAEGLQIWVAVLFLRRFYDIIKLIETS